MCLKCMGLEELTWVPTPLLYVLYWIFMLIGTPIYYLWCFSRTIHDFVFPEEARRRDLRERRRVEQAFRTIDEVMSHATAPQPMEDFFH